MRGNRVGIVAVACGLLSIAPLGCSREEPEPAGEKSALTMTQSEDVSPRALEIRNTKCTVCHTAERFESRHFTAEEWDAVVDQMVERGAELSGDEMEVLRHVRDSE